ncbi:MAG: serine O-acetyltransferase EpsC [Lachnospiraceae bacterium]|nr:serine O-acetyltransferase EpsC [Lachnospiraceae bacterium]
MEELNSRIRGISDAIIDDYRGGKYIDRANNFNEPEQDAVEEIIEILQRIIFPGFYRTRQIRYYTVESVTQTLVEDVHFKLTKQIALAMQCKRENEGRKLEELTKEAQDLSCKFLATIPKIREYIETDLQAEFDGDPAADSKDDIIFSYPGLYAILIYRLAHELYVLKVPTIPRMMSEIAHSWTGIDINPGASIGKYFFIDHGTGIVIGETTIIGDNVKVYQGVTLGALSTRKGQLLKGKKRHPTIEDNVTIYAGASILGGNTVIGKGAVIGANAFITTSIPEGAKISIKNQELTYNFDSDFQVEKKEIDQSDAWFYII